MGEILLRHDELSLHTSGELPRINHPCMHEVYDFCKKYGLPVLFHHNAQSVGYESKPIYVEEIREVLDNHNELQSIWAHACASARTSLLDDYSNVIDELLASYSNLSVDLSWKIYDQEILEGGSPKSDLTGHLKTASLTKSGSSILFLKPSHKLPSRELHSITHSESISRISGLKGDLSVLSFYFEDLLFFAVFFFGLFLADPDLTEDFFLGTFPPFFRASESPIAIACLRLVTFLPLPDFKVPFFFLCMAFLTDLPAFFEYFAIVQKL